MRNNLKNKQEELYKYKDFLEKRKNLLKQGSLGLITEEAFTQVWKQLESELSCYITNKTGFTNLENLNNLLLILISRLSSEVSSILNGSDTDCDTSFDFTMGGKEKIRKAREQQEAYQKTYGRGKGYSM